jgi:capsid assembly protease
MRDGVAILDIIGPIFRYANLFTQISGATSIEQTALDFRTALDDSRVRAIALHIDSPGGALAGVSEFAKQVRSARKPVVAYVSGTAASAGYWIASAAPWVVMSDTAIAGSIGVVAGLRVDKDEHLIEIVSSQSPNKRPDPRTDAGRMQLQRMVDDLAQVFVNAVAEYRRVTARIVVNDFGAGGVLVGSHAVAAGLADQVSTLEDVIASFADGGHGPAYALLLRAKAARADKVLADDAPTESTKWDGIVTQLNDCRRR